MRCGRLLWDWLYMPHLYVADLFDAAIVGSHLLWLCYHVGQDVRNLLGLQQHIAWLNFHCYCIWHVQPQPACQTTCQQPMAWPSCSSCPLLASLTDHCHMCAQELRALGLHPVPVSKPVAQMLDHCNMRKSLQEVWQASTQQLLQLPDALTGDNRCGCHTRPWSRHSMLFALQLPSTDCPIRPCCPLCSS